MKLFLKAPVLDHRIYCTEAIVRSLIIESRLMLSWAQDDGISVSFPLRKAMTATLRQIRQIVKIQLLHGVDNASGDMSLWFTCCS